MSKGSRSLLLSAGIALGAGLLPVATAQSQSQQPQEQQPQQQPFQQQPPQGQQPAEGQPQAQQQGQAQFQQSQQQDFDQLWQMQKEQTRARVAGAVQQLKTACADELHNFCSTVTPGEGRLLLCMQAHEDKIGRQCELALLETSRAIGNVVHQVDTFARLCWPDIQEHCSGTGGSVTQCMMENRSSLSPACRAVVTAMLPPAGGTAQGQPQGQGQQGQAQQGHAPSMVGLSIYSADGMMLGQVTGVKRRPDGSLEAIEADLGSPLGLGATSVLISPSDLRWKGDGVELQMMADHVRSILQGQRR